MESPVKRWLGIALINFFIAAIFGVLMRYAFVAEIPGFDYRYFLHAHSHLAMLGWLYLALYSLLIHFFLPKKSVSRYYSVLFWITQVSVMGMMIAFPLHGYGTWSIVFSTLHIFCSYAFAVKFWLDLNREESNSFFSELFARTAVFFMALSTLALFAIPIIRMTQSGPNALFYNAIQFFLHFQFNGWFIFGILAILVKYLEHHQITSKTRYLSYFYLLLVISCLLTFALAVTWTSPRPWLFLLNSAGVTIQLLALISFIVFLHHNRNSLRTKVKGWVKTLLLIGILSLVVKIIVQTAVVVPDIAVVAYTIRNFVIAFIHLIQLGAITACIMAFILEGRFIKSMSRVFKTGLWLLFMGFTLSELLLGGQGIMFWGAKGLIPYYYENLFAVSILMPLGVLVIAIAYWSQKKAA